LIEAVETACLHVVAWLHSANSVLWCDAGCATDITAETVDNTHGTMQRPTRRSQPVHWASPFTGPARSLGQPVHWASLFTGPARRLCRPGLYSVRSTDRPSDPLPEVTSPQQASRRTWQQL